MELYLSLISNKYYTYWNSYWL